MPHLLDEVTNLYVFVSIPILTRPPAFGVTDVHESSNRVRLLARHLQSTIGFMLCITFNFC